MVTINLDIFRVTGEGKYLEIVASCNKTMQAVFTGISLKYWLTDGSVHTVDLTDALFWTGNYNPDGSKEYTMTPVVATRIDIEQALNIKEPAMYQVTMTAHSTTSSDTAEIIAMCSDVHNVYEYLVQEILATAQSCDGCAKPSSELYMKYLLLWAHLQAMMLKQVTDALTLFQIINKNYRRCGGKGPIIGCGCGK